MLEIGQTISHYHITEKLREGGMVVAGGQRMLVAPGMFVKEDVTGQRTSVGSSSSFDAKLKAADAVTATLDVVVPADGLVLGPDQSHTVDQFRAGKAAIDDLLNAVKAAEQSGQNGLDILRGIADTGRPVDPSKFMQARLARMLMMSPRWKERLEQMSTITLPNSYR